MKYSGHRKLLYELSKLSKFNAFITSSDAKRTLMHLFLFTNSAQREPAANFNFLILLSFQLEVLALWKYKLRIQPESKNEERKVLT